MENITNETTDQQTVLQPIRSRKELLPNWIKIFAWIFIATGILAPIALITALLGLDFMISLYGLETSDPTSPVGISLMLIFLFKGFVAFGLLSEADWAITTGKIDALIGIALCVLAMTILPFIDNQPGFRYIIRLELIPLVGFLIKLRKIEFEWKKLTVANNM